MRDKTPKTQCLESWKKIASKRELELEEARNTVLDMVDTVLSFRKELDAANDEIKRLKRERDEALRELEKERWMSP